MSVWQRKFNEVATRMRGADEEHVRAAIVHAREAATAEGEIVLYDDAWIAEKAAWIAAGKHFRIG